jgi:GNAT superfamily N-acetyltransferase
MTILLANLVARAPTVEDVYPIAELVAACDSAEYGMAGGSARDLASLWQHDSFHLESDAWVIVSARKQFAGFACVWHRDHEEFSTFICVHPQYPERGIGTLLLRMAEQHARELMRHARPGARVSLRGIVSAKNPQARCLFEHEGYHSIREFWRVTLELVEACGDCVSHPGKFDIEIDVESGQLVGIAALYDREGVYSVRHFVTYEKELRQADEECDCSSNSAETLIGTEKIARATVYGAGNPPVLEEGEPVAALRHAPRTTTVQCERS